MPSWAWVVTSTRILLPRVAEMFQCPHGLELLLNCSLTSDSLKPFQCPHGLELLRGSTGAVSDRAGVSMPSWAWVVTARMSNILNFSWCFLCIPAIYRCILAYLPIFFNQLSKFLRCESPSTFLGTCLSHHYFIIFLVTNTNTLLSDLYLISTRQNFLDNARRNSSVNALSGLYLISTEKDVRISPSCSNCVNALSGLYLISTVPLQKPRFYAVSRACFCRYLSEYSDNSRFFVHVNILDIFNEVYLPLTLDLV